MFLFLLILVFHCSAGVPSVFWFFFYRITAQQGKPESPLKFSFTYSFLSLKVAQDGYSSWYVVAILY